MELAWRAAGGTPPDGEPPSPAPLTRLASVWDEQSVADAAQLGERVDVSVDRDTAMRDLYARCHADMVRFAAFLTGDVVAAEDLAHDAFAKVFDAWDRIDDATRLDAYLKATVVNLVRGRHRRRQVAERADTPHLTVVPSAEDDAIDELRRQRTLDAVAALPMRQRTCVVMRHWMRMTESEIADTLELSVGSVRTHVKRGMAALQQTLGGAS